MISYIEIEPDFRLKAFVDSYWISFGSVAPGRDRKRYLIHPDCCCDIIFNLGDPVHSLTTSGKLNTGRSYFVGTATKFAEVEPTGTAYLAGIRFLPAGLKVFTHAIDLKEGKNQTAELSIFGPDEAFKGKVPTLEEVKSRMDLYLLQKMRRGYSPDRRVSNAVEVVKQRMGLIRISELCETVGTSERNLERLFASEVGLTPKEFSKTVKLIHIKKRMRSLSRPDLTQIAFDFDYYDLAHFSRDFSQFAGVIPSAF